MQNEPHQPKIRPVEAVALLAKSGERSCDCLSCQTGRPDYPCLIEEDQ